MDTHARYSEDYLIKLGLLSSLCSADTLQKLAQTSTTSSQDAESCSCTQCPWASTSGDHLSTRSWTAYKEEIKLILIHTVLIYPASWYNLEPWASRELHCSCRSDMPSTSDHMNPSLTRPAQSRCVSTVLTVCSNADKAKQMHWTHSCVKTCAFTFWEEADLIPHCFVCSTVTHTLTNQHLPSPRFTRALLSHINMKDFASHV